jgi:hypothetical protein
VSDRHDERFASLRRAASLAAALVVAACGRLEPPVPPGPTVPCTRAVAIATDTVVISAGVCNPWCIHVAARTPVYFINGDPTLYYFTADPALTYEDVQVPGNAGTATLPLPAGTVIWTAAHQPAATVTVFVE